MSPLGVAHWKIEFIPKTDPSPQTVVSRMSPLGVAQWKIEFSPRSGELPQKWVIAPNGGVTNEPPWGNTVEN